MAITFDVGIMDTFYISNKQKNLHKRSTGLLILWNLTWTKKFIYKNTDEDQILTLKQRNNRMF